MSGKLKVLSKLKSMAVVACGGVAAFTAMSIYNENEQFYDDFLMPMIHTLDAETSHNVALTACKYKLFPKSKFKDLPSLSSHCLGLQFSNPLGVAAGLDKQGEAVESLHDIGFGFVEVGSITPEPQSGQACPRLFRLPENQALINRMGFNSDGHAAVHERLVALRKTGTGSKLRIGVNLGKNKTSTDAIADYTKGIQVFSDVADYLVVNISSPNTAGLRDLQSAKPLRELLSSLIKVRNAMPSDQQKPLLLKLSPDLTDFEKKEIATIVLDPACRVDGLLISNTTVARPSYLKGQQSQEIGGLSGKPLLQSSTALIYDMFRLTKGQLPIIGVGGVSSGKDAYQKILAGASLVQLYTAFTYKGPPLVTRVKKELDEHLRLNGWSNVSEAIGKGHLH